MKVSGFTFVKNAVKYDYPVVESIRSILPLVNEMIVCLGDSTDETNDLICSIKSKKIKLIHSVWDKNLREGGEVLAVETNKAMDAVSNDADWLIYIQADEVVHEQYYNVIQAAMETYKQDDRVEGLLFNYRHFYGSYKYLGDGRKWYSKEIRVIRNNKKIRSYQDAQGFRIDGRKLNVKLIDAYIHHYGWVRNPIKMREKYIDFGKNWNDDVSQDYWSSAYKKESTEAFDYSKIDALSLYTGTHPEVMKSRIEAADWDFSMDIHKKKFTNFKQKALYFLWQHFGWRPLEYRNYKRLY